MKTENAESGSDRPMTSKYVQVIVLQAVIVLLLWLFGRYFA